MDYLDRIGRAAKAAAVHRIPAQMRNAVLNDSAVALRSSAAVIIEANSKDIDAAANAGMKSSFIDRLTLNDARINEMADGLEAVALLPDPLGETTQMRTLPSGLSVGQRSVPLGVVCMIYEARPNVTADAFGLCFKSGNAVILRGGKEALHSNTAIVGVLQEVLERNGLPGARVQLITEISRDVTMALMKLNSYIDVLIPRGGQGLIKSVVENSTVPVIETGAGNCHVFVDGCANIKMAAEIAVNAKVHRPGVCNACETLLVHRAVADEFVPLICKELQAHGVEVRGDETVVSLMGESVEKALQSDWETEYLDYIIAVKVVDGIDEAIVHIREYSTGHSEAIVTENYSNAQRFLDEVDSAAVYVNASTRFTDGNEFGLGAEIGISTQKLHARGPMGLEALTSKKFIIYGGGQIRG
jgi:glutamate-5-semialdehyde dehydrogenase